MNRAMRRNLSPLAADHLKCAMLGPLTKAEKRESRRIVAGLGSVTWYHGGLPGRAEGDFLLPPRLTTRNPRAEGGFYGQRDYVYMTPDLFCAVWYAGEVAGGTVYVVKPMGEVMVDPWALRSGQTDDAPQFCASHAKVLEVLPTEGPGVREEIALFLAIQRARTPEERNAAHEAALSYASACQARGAPCEAIEEMLR